jgi:hypothetical protein
LSHLQLVDRDWHGILLLLLLLACCWGGDIIASAS